jgi:tetratricopeptide (TPR) repeat protein
LSSTDLALPEIAQNFKEHGNEYFKGKRYREAANFYLQGIDAKPTDQSLLESLLLNRAACNLKLGEKLPFSLLSLLKNSSENYGSVLRDCSKALTINQQSSKAYFRSASALKALERYDEALDCCNRCLAYDKENDTIQTMRSQLLEWQTAQVERRKRKEQEAQQKKLEGQRLRFALRVSPVFLSTLIPHGHAET